MAIPAIPPKDARIKLSVNSSRMRRRRPAPSAKRTAISRARARERLRRSPATLVQATSRTANARITKITPNFQFSSSMVRAWNWVYTAAPRLRLTLEYSLSKFFARTASSFRACCERHARFQARLYVQLAIVAVLEKILLEVGGKDLRHGQRHVKVGMAEYQQSPGSYPEPRQSR